MKLLVTLGSCWEFMRLAATLVVAVVPTQKSRVHRVCVASAGLVATDKTQEPVRVSTGLWVDFRLWVVSHEFSLVCGVAHR